MEHTFKLTTEWITLPRESIYLWDIFWNWCSYTTFIIRYYTEYYVAWFCVRWIFSKWFTQSCSVISCNTIEYNKKGRHCISVYNIILVYIWVCVVYMLPICLNVFMARRKTYSSHQNCSIHQLVATLLRILIYSKWEYRNINFNR